MEFPPDADPLREWRTGTCRKNGPGEFWGFEDWKSVTSMFLDLERCFSDRFRIIRYEAFVNSAEIQTRRLFSWLGLDVREQTLQFLRKSQSLHNEHSRSVFKDPMIADRWRDSLNPEIRNAIEQELLESPLSTFLNISSGEVED